jgi:hypothetical protein
MGCMPGRTGTIPFFFDLSLAAAAAADLEALWTSKTLMSDWE